MRTSSKSGNSLGVFQGSMGEGQSWRVSIDDKSGDSCV